MIQLAIAAVTSVMLVMLNDAPVLPASISPAVHASVSNLSVQLSSSTPRPGDVLIVRASVDGAALMEGRLDNRPVWFAPAEVPDIAPGDAARAAGQFIALVGLDALVKPGPYTLIIKATGSDGSVSQEIKTITVLPRNYVLESVKLNKTLSATLDPEINIAEAQEVANIYSGFNAEKWWAGPLRWPITGKLSAVYGNRRMYNGINLGTYHSGIDIVASKGLTVVAAAPGRVVAVRPYVVRGLTVVMDHGRGVFTSYDHLSEALVAEGQMVNVGDPIGRVGTTGRSQGPHLHFELAVGGAPVDPTYWMRVALP